jgi:RND family efflux transporter MFP subunit
MLFWAASIAHAHEGGHDDVPPPTANAQGLPRLTTKSDVYELVAVLDGERLKIYLDRYEDNSPVSGAVISVLIGAETISAEAAPDGTYIISSPLFRGSGSLDLVFDINAAAGDDLLPARLSLGTSISTQGLSAPIPWSERVMVALRHAAHDHLVLLTGALMIGGLVVGFVWRLSRRRLPALQALLLVSLICVASPPKAWAHEGHDHADDSSTQTAPTGDRARRLPDGTIFVPKPMQRILDIRTVIAKSATAQKSVVLAGRVITNPNRSGVVQSINGGRVSAPENGLPRLGQRVSKGDILALVEPAMPIADRTTIAERAGELEQLITVAEAKLLRLRPLAERGVTPQSQIIDADAELQGLYRRRDVVRDTRIAPEVLRAPIDGVIGSSRVVSGQVVQVQDLLFQIVDPTSLWIEAYDYGDTDPSRLEHPTAVGSSGASMSLEFQGWSRTLQQQTTIMHFAISDPPELIRVGQPVTVTARQSETTMGVIVNRDAVVRGNSGEAIIWRHIEAEQFEPRPVRTLPFDADRVMIVAGASDGDRIVVRGAELINQIR